MTNPSRSGYGFLPGSEEIFVFQWRLQGLLSPESLPGPGSTDTQMIIAVHMSLVSPMVRISGFVLAIALAELLVAPGSASFVLSGVTLSPVEVPLLPGETLSLDTTLAILPSGTTTFNSGHSIQITTGLLSPVWDVQVLVNGNPAAKIPDQGNAVFINGYLLSYPENQDVSVLVRLTGTVPASSGQDIVLLQAEEIDNSGNIVPGSTRTVTEPVGQPVTTGPAATGAGGAQSARGAVPAPTRTGGFSLPAAIAAVSLITAVLFVRIRRPDKRSDDCVQSSLP